jgi:hypothetical protein
MEDNPYMKGDKNQILNNMLHGPDPGSRAYEQMRMGIFVRCTEDIEKVINSSTDAIKDFTNSNNRLSKQILILNVIFGIFTIVGTILGGYQLFWK